VNYSRITAVIDHLLAQELRHALLEAGLDHYATLARSAHLEERRGITGLFSGGVTLQQDAADLLTLFVPADQELAVLDLIAHHGRLVRPGMGSVYSDPLLLLRGFEPLLPQVTIPPATLHHTFYPDLVGIGCVVRRGRGDHIALEVLTLNASVPTLSFGTGLGLRDRLGLLRITIPAEKEIISLVDSQSDAEEVMEHMVRAGRLHLPGQGLIYSYPVSHGLINTRLSRGQVGQAASVDRIVAALDRLTGGIDWRSAAGERPRGRRRGWFSGVEATLITPEQHADELFARALGVGVTGATIAPLRLAVATGHPAELAKARLAVAMLLPERLLEPLLAALEEAGAFGAEFQSLLAVRRVDRAFTYRV